MNRLKQFLFRRRLYNDLDEEIAFHLEQRVQELVADGMSEVEANAAARRAFGNVGVVKETAREAWGWRPLEDLLRDARLGARILRKSPGFTAIAVLILALGIGANTAIFSLIDAALLRSLPVRDPERLVVLQWTAHRSPSTKGQYSYMSCPQANAAGEHGCSFSYPLFREFQNARDAFSTVTALGADAGLNLRGNGPAKFVRGELVSGEFFETLGVGASLGRTLTPTDDAPGAPPVAVLSYSYWQSAFGADRAVVGKTIWLNNVAVTIVGVAAKEFPGIDPSRAHQMWLPLSLQPQHGKNLNGSSGGDKPSLQAGDDIWWVYLVARLAPGVTQAKAQATAETLFQNNVLDPTTKLFHAEDAPRLILMPAPQAISELREELSKPLTILMTAVSLVLLVACANVAGLVLARSAARQKELALRLALGAGRPRIAAQLLTESILLSGAGGVAGILLAYWSLPSLVAFMSRGGVWPAHLAVRLDLRVLAFTLTASVLTGILSGVAPLFRGSRLDLASSLKVSPAAFSSRVSRRRWPDLGGSLVITQVALSVLMMAGAGLLVRSLRNLQSIEPGFDTRNILIFGIDPTLNGYTEQQSRNLYSQLREGLQALPGVLSVTYSFDSLLSGSIWSSSFHLQSEAQHAQHETAALAVGPNFFDTMRIPLISGRAFSPRDFTSPSDGGPVVINEAFARTFLKDTNPLGTRILGLGSRDSSYEIIGIAGDAKYTTLRSEIRPTAYVPQKGGDTTFEVRTAVNPRTIIPAVRGTLRQLDENLPLSNLTTQSEVIDRSLFQERLIARLSSFFGALSLLLACVGLYGLLSFEVTSATRGIGIRMALGARPADILRFVVGRGVVLSAVGAILGILAALGATRYIASLLYGVRPYDPLTFAAAGLLFLAVALVATYIPARRATRVDPNVALRYE